MISRTLIRAGIGFLIGIAVGNFMAIIIGYATTGGAVLFSEELLARTGSVAGALLLHNLMSGLYGAIAMGGVSLYEIESWGLLKIAVIHYLIIAVTFYPIAAIAGWDFGSPASNLIFSGIQAVAYAIIWLVMYVHYKLEVKELNQMLEAKAAD